MGKPRVSAGGGLASISYALRLARRVGGIWDLYRRMRSKNACKTCALGMGGQRGGMVNESGHFPEVCKKSLQAQAGDMQSTISELSLREYPFARLERLTSAQLERLGRIAFPMIAEEGESHFRRIDWDQALLRTAAEFKKARPREVFFYSSGRSSNEAAFLMQVVARAYGTPHIHNCSCYCHNASGVALSRVYGSGTSSVVLNDIANTDLVLVAGANPACNHPRMMSQLVSLRRRGGKVIVVNPLRELGLVRFRVPSDWRSLFFGSDVADLYLQPHVGADVAVFKAMLKGLLENNLLNIDYIDNYTIGWEGVRADVESVTWESLVEVGGVGREDLERAVELIGASRRGILCWAMGLTHHSHGVENVLALANLALARGWLGRPGCGLLPIRGHSNVQGVGSMGVTPQLKQAFAERMRTVYGIKQGKNPGWDTYRSMKAASEGKVKVAFMLGGNLFASNPDRDWASKSLCNVPLNVYVSTKLNESHVHGRGRTTIVLPALARDEEAQSTTQESMFNYVRLSEGGEPLVDGEMRSEVDIIASLAELILPRGRFDWSSMKSHRGLREQIAQLVPGYGAIGSIDQTGKEFQIAGRTFHQPRFATEDGRARFHVTPLSGFTVSPEEFRLMTLRSEGQFNTVVYEEEDLYRGNDRRDVVMMSGEDARRLRLDEGDRVLVETEAGSLTACVAIVDIRAGSLAMYFPEANVLVPRKIDAASGTPAFKSVVARVVPLGSAVSDARDFRQGAA